MALNSEYPLPVFYTFVFTDQEGHHMFAACLKFFEKVPLAALEPIAKEIFGDVDILNLPPDAGIFCPKVICVLSHKPFYRGMGRYLKHIYSLSLSSSICPLEHFITSVVSKIPLPCHGGRPFHVVLDAALIAPTSRPMKPVVFKMPSHRFFPLMDLDFAGPLRCLSVDMMLAVFVLMLREAKIVFLSSSNTMLTETMETLRCLLFPLTWSSCFVSRLPTTLGGLLQAPGGFMIGLHIEPTELNHQQQQTHSTHQGSFNNKSNKQYLQDLMKKYIQYMHFDYPLLSGTYIIDLNCNLAYQFNGKYSEVLQHSQIDNLLKTLPSGPKLRLKTYLQRLADEYRIAPQMVGLEELDSAFDFQQQTNFNNDGQDKIHWELFPTLQIRDAFLSFMIDILGEYPKYMKPPTIELIEDTYRTFQEEFNIAEYIHDCSSNNNNDHHKVLLEYLMETQMFSVLIQSRSEATAEPLVFFEEAARLQRELGLVAGAHNSPNHNNKGNTVYTPASNAGHSYGICELPEPLYVLLEAENRWSNLSKIMQQQILQQSSLYNFEDKTLKQYLIKYFTTSSLAQIRNLGNNTSSLVNNNHNNSLAASITEAFYPINNQKLLDLLIFIDFSNGMTDIDDEFNVTGGTTTNLNTLSYAALRTELDRGEDLHLAESNYGALILPGPIIPVTYDEEESAHPLASSLPQYTYKDGWPRLDSNLLATNGEISHPKIADLIQERAFEINKINPLIRLLIRSPSERLTAENVTKLRQINVNAFTSVDPATFKIHKDITTALSALLDISSLSVTMLTLRIVNQVKPVNDILQILGILSQIEYSGIHFYIHENIWRSVLVGCSTTGGDVMRRISVVIRDCLLSLQFHLDALTYGQFIKANQAAKVKSFTAKQSGDILDQFLHLEELGYVWYQQKALPPTVPHSPPVVEKSSSSKDPYHARIKGPVKTPLQQALDQVIKQLILQKSEGLMPFHRPRQTSATRLPIIHRHFISQHHIPLLKKEFQNRLDTIYVQVRKWASEQQQQTQNQQNQRVNSHDKKANSSLSRPSNAFSLASASAISPLSNAMSKFGKGFFSSGNKSAKNSPVPNHNNSDETSSFTTGRLSVSSTSSVSPPPLNKGFSFSKFLGGGGHSKSTTSTNLQATFDSVNERHDSGGGTELDQVNLKLALDEVATTLPTIDESPHSNDETLIPTNDETANELHNSHSELVVDVTIPDINSTETPPPEEVKLSLNELQDRLLENFANDFTQQKRALSIHNYNPCRECGYVMMDEELMNVWFRASSIDVHKPTDRMRSCRDLNQDKGIVCPECERSIQPKLYITCLSLTPSQTSEGGETLQDLHILWQQEVLFINPFLLRFEVEELLVKFGERINQIDWLYTYYPAIVWNILWYSNRCHLPSGFTTKEQVDYAQSLPSSTSSSAPSAPVTPTKKQRDDYFPKLYPRKEYEIIGTSNDFERYYKKDDLDLPIIIGWRESVVKAKVLRLLQGKSGNYLDIRDLYPDLSDKEFEIITGSVLSNLDGSPFGMRQAMLNLSDCSSLFEPILSEYQKSKQEKLARQQKAEEAAKKKKEKMKNNDEDSNENNEKNEKDSNTVENDDVDEDDEDDEGNESDDSSEIQNASPRGNPLFRFILNVLMLCVRRRFSSIYWQYNCLLS